MFARRSVSPYPFSIIVLIGVIFIPLFFHFES